MSTTRPECLRIGELAREFHLNPKTIRYYEDIGLLPTPERSKGGFRLYGHADRERLIFINKAKAIGLSLEEIAELLSVRKSGGKPCKHLLGLLDHKVKLLDHQIRTMTEFRHELIRLRDESVIADECDGKICAIVERYEAPRGNDGVSSHERALLNFNRES
ncbi:heavy metal-responsive transcriptional regulator [Deinococcus peraridilitoris]|uniref:Putative transcriptional regulator n=1 Tax=Deinococcus peraridilitoris (strain DSM 19664 / LMG 22246 / CIP 109416 / KR-200) TaxID=937777 RepID=L0A751_DEIPD|nr:heavy metal-responsive transcriptional regulator [Deinococcus peraridilitoris]AFZ69279.1 putative transcriptional regulator [Deinococcus peraridilitoris DSM 19664]